jgi:extracellular matrix regulatory protein A
MSTVAIGHDNYLPINDIELVIQHNSKSKSIRELISLKAGDERFGDATNGKRTRSVLLTKDGYLILSAISTKTIAERSGTFVHLGKNDFINQENIEVISQPTSRAISEFFRDKKYNDLSIDLTRGKKTRSIILTTSGYVVSSIYRAKTLSNRFHSTFAIDNNTYVMKQKVELILDVNTNPIKKYRELKKYEGKYLNVSHGKKMNSCILTNTGYFFSTSKKSKLLASNLVRPISLGNNNFIPFGKVQIIAKYDTRPLIRLSKTKKEEQLLVDVTNGKPTKSIILTSSQFSVLTHILPRSIAKKEPDFQSIGHNNFIPKESILYIFKRQSRPVLRFLEQKNYDGKIVNLSFGRKARTVIALRNGLFLYSSFTTNSISKKNNHLVPIGLGNFVRPNLIEAALNPKSKPLRKISSDKHFDGSLLDITQGKKSRSLIFLIDGSMLISASSPSTFVSKVGEVLPIGFGSFLNKNKVNMFINHSSRPIKTFLKKKKRNERNVLDSSYGNKIKTIIVTDFFVFLSSITNHEIAEHFLNNK